MKQTIHWLGVQKFSFPLFINTEKAAPCAADANNILKVSSVLLDWEIKEFDIWVTVQVPRNTFIK